MAVMVSLSPFRVSGTLSSQLVAGGAVAHRRSNTTPALALGLDMLEEATYPEVLTKRPGGKVLTYDHMPKAGGTYLEHMLRTAVKMRHFHLLREFDTLQTQDVLTTFTVGSIRNPCDYYLSLWSYGVEHGGAMKHTIPPDVQYVYNTTTPDKSSQEDIDHFRAWVKGINVPGWPGVMSVRFAKSYVRDAAGIDGSRAPVSLPRGDLTIVRRDMRRFEKDHVDCWVRTENMNEDTTECLKRWESAGGMVYWEDYNAAQATAPLWSSDHLPCSSYFDQETANLVWSLEGPIFRLFNYNTCCEPFGPKANSSAMTQ